MFIDTNISLKVTRREGGTLGCSKNSAISGKFEI